MIKNVKIYGLEESVKASKYPMSTDVNKCTEEITSTVKSLSSCMTGTEAMAARAFRETSSVLHRRSTETISRTFLHSRRRRTRTAAF